VLGACPDPVGVLSLVPSFACELSTVNFFLRDLCVLCGLCVKFFLFLLTLNCRLSTSFLDLTMKNKKPNAELVWKQLEDLLAPRLRLSVIDRTVYSHLLRHSRREGKLRLRFSILGLGRNIRLSTGSVREAVRRLVAHGALRMVQRSKAGHVVEVRLPGEIRAVRLNRIFLCKGWAILCFALTSRRRYPTRHVAARSPLPISEPRAGIISDCPLYGEGDTVPPGDLWRQDMKASLLYRIASVLLLLFAAGHTLGFRQNNPEWERTRFLG
jgi:hypothetical protein